MTLPPLAHNPALPTAPQRELIWSRAAAAHTPQDQPLDPALMALVLDNISTRVAVINRERRYTYANQLALEFMSLPPEQVIGRHMSEVLDDGVYESWVPLLERLFDGDSLQIRGWVDYQKQGLRFREQRLIPFSRDGGPVEAVLVCGVDHTEQRLSEHELAQRLAQLNASEALKASIVDHALAALVTTDADGRIVEFNPAAQVMFGRSLDEARGRPVSDVVIPERFRERHLHGMARMQAGGEARVMGKRMELYALRADGSEFPIEMVLWRTNVDGETFYTSSMVDVSQRHSAAREIERQREVLRQSEKLAAMGSLLAGVAHELNNPLAIVMGRASLLEEKHDDPQIKADAARIREAADRCGRIVRTFLNMARSRPVQRSSVALNDLVRAATDMLAYSLRTHGIELRLELADSLPEVMADGDQLGQVLLNLLVNAQQALVGTAEPSHETRPPGRHGVSVQTGLEPASETGARHVWLRVADNGPGVPSHLAERVFDPFFTTKPEGMGTGLGLAVSRSVVLEHGGDLLLEAHSAAGGASFLLRLPVTLQHELPSAPLPPAEAEASVLARLLVVDDEPELTSLMRDMLERAGYEVATAESGAVALELLDEARFDAIVSDLRMPEMDGTAFWRAVSQKHPQLAPRMLFVTGDTLSPDAREFLDASGCSSLDKPFTKPELLRKVASLLA